MGIVKEGTVQDLPLNTSPLTKNHHAEA